MKVIDLTRHPLKHIQDIIVGALNSNKDVKVIFKYRRHRFYVSTEVIGEFSTAFPHFIDNRNFIWYYVYEIK